MDSYRQTSCSAANYNKLWLGGCYSNKTTQSATPIYYNTTYPLPIPRNGQPNGGGACDCSNALNNSPNDNNNWGAGNGDIAYWQGNVYSSSYIGNGTPADLLTVQSFSNSGSIDLSDKCFNLGFKNLVASRQWHGTYPWNSNDGCLQTQSLSPDQTRYTSVSFSETYINNKNVPGEDQETNLCTANGSISVNPLTGILTNDLVTTQLSYDTSINPHVKFADINGGSGTTIINGVGVTGSYGMTTTIDAFIGNDLHCNYPIFGSAGMDSFISQWNTNYSASGAYLPPIIGDSYGGSATYIEGSGSGDHLHLTADLSFNRGSTVCNWSCSLVLSYTGSIINEERYYGTRTLGGANSASGVVADCESLLGYWDLGNDTLYPWRTDNHVAYAPLITRREVQQPIDPVKAGFLPHLIADYRNPVTDLNGNGAFTSGDPAAVSPWTYNSASNDCSGNPSGSDAWGGPCTWVPTYAATNWFDTNDKNWKWEVDSGSLQSGLLASSIESTHMDGAILGSPLTFIGGAIGIGWFDFYYDDIRYCDAGTDCTPRYEQFVYAHGASLSDANISNEGTPDGEQYINFLPVESTHWTDNNMAHGIPRGASLSCNIINGITAIKWAECRINTPSQNFFRPCGKDKVAIDETTATVFIDDSLTMYAQLPGLTTSTYVLISQTETDGYDGIYTGCSQTLAGSNYVLTLGTKVAPLPSDYNHDFSFNDGASMFGLVGMLRFPSAWSICGRTGVSTSDTLSGSTYVNFNDAQDYLYNGDSITLYNAGMTSLGDYTVSTGSSASQYIISASYTGSIRNALYAMSTGAPSYFWNDELPKYQFRQGQWYTSNRNSAFNTSGSCGDNCIDNTPCNPSVVVFSPNAESFKTGQKYWFGGEVPMTSSTSVGTSFVADGVYGSILQQNVEFTMTDLYYQKPFTPPMGGMSYQEDGGLCSDDTGTVTYYPPRPLVEAMCDVPSGITLPSGVSIPPLTQPPIPGVIGYSFNEYQQPWNLCLNEMSQTSSCRFWDYYQFRV